MADWLTSGEFRGLGVKRMSYWVLHRGKRLALSGGRSEARRDDICVAPAPSSVAS